jgi:hypothetical protein
MLSIDFLAGFTIFLLALIVAAGMVPGMLAGLQSATIDYDGVAYRTSVILAEDPGWFEDPNGGIGTSWESKPDESIQRMGLAVSKETPNILSSAKIERFFNQTHYENDPAFYRKTVFFSDYPYSYNINLKTLDGSINHTLGEPLPRGDYGYIRRAAMVKEPGEAVVNFTSSTGITPSPATNGTFAVAMNFSELLGQPDAYRIDPFEDRVNITLTGLGSTFNGTTSANLTGVWAYRYYDTPSPGDWSPVPPKISADHLMIGGSNVSSYPAPVNNSENITLSLEPGYFSGKASETSLMEIRFLFNSSETCVNGTFQYNSTTAPLPSLKPAVLEVAVW